MVITIVTTTLLIIEYRFFKDQSHKLLMLQKNYQDYVTTFKNVLNDYYKVKEQEHDILTQDEKKKSIISPKKDFIVVNRDLDYLKESALTLSREYDIEYAVKHMYDLCDWDYVSGQTLLPAYTTTKKPTVNRLRKARIVKSQLPSDQGSREYYQRDIHLKWPMERGSFWIGSKFGPRKKANGTWGFHYGLDLPAPKGTPVEAVADGEVIESSYSSKGYGKSVVIKHNKKYKTRYAHLDTIFVRAGQKVSAGQCIGKVGATGHVFGKKPYHLHFEVMVFGKKINPLYILN